MNSFEKNPELSKLVVARHSPKPEVQSIEDWEEYVRNHSGTTYHPVGSCSMMPREMGGVLDPQLRVYGTENLRGTLDADPASKAELTVQSPVQWPMPASCLSCLPVTSKAHAL